MSPSRPASLLTWVLVVALVGCQTSRDKDATSAPSPGQEIAVIVSEPCPSMDAPHKWTYYPDEPLYYCDRHGHHWIPDGAGGWAHVHRYDKGRPNYAAPGLTNQTRFHIYRDHEAHAAQYPPGTRR